MGGLIATLDHHPQIFFAVRREHRFFARGGLLETAPDLVREDFKDANSVEGERLSEDRVLHGEREFDPERASKGCPHAKVIFILRDPVVRAHQQFLHALSEKKETVRNFENAIEAELSGLRSPETTGRCWLYKNQYHKHIQHWLSFYNRDTMLFLIYEEWLDSVGKTLEPAEKFFGLKPKSLVISSSFNEPEPRKKRVISDLMREQLEDLFAIDKSYVSNLIGREIPSWKRS